MTDRVEQGEDGLPIFLFDYPTFDEEAAQLRQQWLREESLKLRVRRPESMIIITDCS